jgi:hypothetical protein
MKYAMSELSSTLMNYDNLPQHVLVRPDDAEAHTDADAPHLRREPSNISPHAGLDVLRRGRCAPERLEFSVGGLDATADASKIVAIRVDWDRLELRVGREAINPCLARGENRLLRLKPLLHCPLVGQEPIQLLFEHVRLVVSATGIAPQARAPILDPA